MMERQEVKARVRIPHNDTRKLSLQISSRNLKKELHLVLGLHGYGMAWLY